MPPDENFGHCDLCGEALDAFHHSLDRLIEQLSYPPPDETGEALISARVLFAESLEKYCCAPCASEGISQVFKACKLRLSFPGAGPIEACARCGAPVDLSQPHVVYQHMVLTETRQPWLTQIEPHEVIVLAVVCPTCDGHLDDAVQHCATLDDALEAQPVKEDQAT